MFELWRLPPELLGLVLDFHDVSSQVILLWKCGNRRLNINLASGVTFVALKDERWTSTSRYPKMLSSLVKLRHLSIQRGEGPLMPVKELSIELQKLSGTLKTLRIDCFEALSSPLLPC